MELSGEVIIGVPPQQVWAGLNDAEVLRQSIPGCEEVQQISPTETHTRVLLKMGPVRARFVGKILMSDVRPGAGCTLNFEGSGGAAGFARGSSVVELTPDGTGTKLHYSASASIGGKLGQIGGRMIDASAKQMADQFFNAFRACLDAPAATEAAVAPAAGATAAATVPGAFTPVVATRPAVAAAVGAPSAGLGSESVRVMWFLLGAASTGFGVWLASRLAH
ncbi:MAG: carbon monoxide dehydrogenase subunit G [Herminiimonas sp.]|nr:carbon monoxide dehydrogenase subunit G [Herminiimonas sp.]